MHKLIMMRGLPFSGKTSWIKAAYEKENPYIVSYKKTLKAGGFDLSNHSEEFLMQPMKRFHLDIMQGIRLGQRFIILDNCNLTDYHETSFREYARIWEYEFSIIDLQTSLDECLRRQRLSLEKTIDRDTLINMAFKYGRAEQKGPFAIYELEGIICDNSHRIVCAEILSDGSYSSFLKGFYDVEDVVDDGVNLDIKKKINEDINEGLEIIILTRRPEILRQSTELWLMQKGITYSRLIMMPSDSDDEVKFKEYAMTKYMRLDKCVKFYENSPSVLSDMGEFISEWVEVIPMESTYEKI